MVNRLQALLTKWQLRVNGAEFVGLKKYPLPNNKEADIFVFDADYQCKGASTLFSTITIKNNIFDNYSQRVQDYIISHEMGHIRHPALFYLTTHLLLFAFSILKGIAICILALSFIWSGLIIFHELSILHGLLIVAYSILTIMLSTFFSWVSELDADFYAIGLLGLNNIMIARIEMTAEEGMIPFRKKLSRFTRRPPPQLTFYLYKKLGKNRNDAYWV